MMHRKSNLTIRSSPLESPLEATMFTLVGGGYAAAGIGLATVSSLLSSAVYSNAWRNGHEPGTYAICTIAFCLGTSLSIPGALVAYNGLVDIVKKLRPL